MGALTPTYGDLGAKGGWNNSERGNGFLLDIMPLLRSIYAWLPALYLAGGIVCASSLELRGLAGLSAVLLVAAGLVTAFWRYRQQRWLAAARHWPARAQSRHGAVQARLRRGSCTGEWPGDEHGASGRTREGRRCHRAVAAGPASVRPVAVRTPSTGGKPSSTQPR